MHSQRYGGVHLFVVAAEVCDVIDIVHVGYQGGVRLHDQSYAKSS